MTHVGVEICPGRPKLRLVGGSLAPRLITADATGARVALVATTALLLGGDSVHIDVCVGPGAWLEIVETAGTVAYDAQGQASTWAVHAEVGSRGMLLWHGEPLVVSRGADVLRTSTVELGERSVVCLRETVVLGRSGESGGALFVRNRVSLRGDACLAEDLDLRSAGIRELPGLIGTAKVLDTVSVLGIVAPDNPLLRNGFRFDLDGSAGSVGRALRTELAGSPAGGWWGAWSESARSAYRAARGGG